jgi:hypothetical protein
VETTLASDGRSRVHAKSRGIPMRCAFEIEGGDGRHACSADVMAAGSMNG